MCREKQIVSNFLRELATTNQRHSRSELDTDTQIIKIPAKSIFLSSSNMQTKDFWSKLSISVNAKSKAVATKILPVAMYGVEIASPREKGAHCIKLGHRGLHCR